MALSLDTLIQRLKQQLIIHKKEGKLLDTDNNQVELDLEDPIYLWNEYTKADKEGRLVYYPKSFNQTNHQGKTKQQLIESGHAWRVSLVEDLPDLPGQGSGKIISGRKQLEAYKSPNDYLKLLQTDPQYTQEQGFTPEEWITYFLTHLEATNQIIDDYQSKGKVSYLPGTFFTSQGLLPCGCCGSGAGRAELFRDGPAVARGRYATRSSVGV